MFDLYAKNGVPLLMLRLKASDALLLKRGLKLWLQPAVALMP